MQITSTDAKIVILGISEKPERYSFKAARRLWDNGYKHLVGVSPAKPTVAGVTSVATLAEIATPIDTITVYVSPVILDGLIPDILAARPRRLILNPGTEHANLSNSARAAGIVVEEACTLVLLASGRF